MRGCSIFARENNTLASLGPRHLSGFCILFLSHIYRHTYIYTDIYIHLRKCKWKYSRQSWGIWHKYAQIWLLFLQTQLLSVFRICKRIKVQSLHCTNPQGNYIDEEQNKFLHGNKCNPVASIYTLHMFKMNKKCANLKISQIVKRENEIMHLDQDTYCYIKNWCERSDRELWAVWSKNQQRASRKSSFQYSYWLITVTENSLSKEALGFIFESTHHSVNSPPLYPEKFPEEELLKALLYSKAVYSWFCLF